MDIQPGSRVTLTVTSFIRSDSARKTLARLFVKDPEVAKLRRRGPKPVTDTRRAGRIWKNRPSGSIHIAPQVGESAKLLATVDVIRDLQSVSRYVEVK